MNSLTQNLNSVELVIFDLAGTTVEDRGEVPGAFSSALAEHGIEVSAEELKTVRGSSKRDAVLHFIPPGPERLSRAASVYAAFLKQLTQRYQTDGVHPAPGAAAVFQSLRDRGVQLALNTGFERETAALLLDQLRWSDGIFDAIVCGDDVKQGRPAPYLIFRAMEAARMTSVQSVANVGDTVLDLQAGYNAGVRWNIGVLSGAHNRSMMQSAPHTHLITSIAELPDLWESV